MLLQNKSFLTCNGLIYLSGAPAVKGPLTRVEGSGYLNTYKNRYIGDAGMNKSMGFPGGYAPGTAWLPAFTAGGIAASRGGLVGEGEVSDANLAGGKHAVATLIGSGRIATLTLYALGWITSKVLAGSSDFTGAITGVRWGLANLAGVGNISEADLDALAWIGITLAGLGTIGSANLAGGLKAVADITGSGNVSSANLGALAGMLATLQGAGILTPEMMAGVFAAVTIAGSGLCQADIEALTKLGTTITAVGTISDAQPIAGAPIAATVSGAGSFEADIFALLKAIASLSGVGQLNLASDIIGARWAETTIEGRATLAASIEAVATMLASLTGTGDVDPSIRATGNIAATVTPFETLSPQSLAAAVWNSFYNVPGTMGAKVNAAASAGDPWTTELPGDYPEGSAGYVLGELVKGGVEELLARLTILRAAALDKIPDLTTTVELLKKIQVNKLELVAGTTNNWILYDDNDINILLTWSVSSVGGTPIIVLPGSAARRSKGV